LLIFSTVLTPNQKVKCSIRCPLEISLNKYFMHIYLPINLNNSENQISFL